MPGCSALGCSNRSEKGFRMKVFPRDPTRRALWEAAASREKWKATDSSYLCEVHFDENQWEKRRVDNARKLKPNAVPTLFVFPGPMKTTEPLPETITCESELVLSKGTSVTNVPEQSEDARPSTSTCSAQISYNDPDKVIRDLKLAILKRDKRIANQNALLHNLRKQIIKMRKETLRSRRSNQKLRDKLQSIFNADQLSSLNRSSMNFTKWSNETVSAALGLRFSCGSNGYENLLKLNLPYPSLRTLRRRKKT